MSMVAEGKEYDISRNACLLFGGKVEYPPYLLLMEACASEGILCVLVEMPFNLAVFDLNAANGIQEMYPEIQDWYSGQCGFV